MSRLVNITLCTALIALSISVVSTQKTFAITTASKEKNATCADCYLYDRNFYFCRHFDDQNKSKSEFGFAFKYAQHFDDGEITQVAQCATSKIGVFDDSIFFLES